MMHLESVLLKVTKRPLEWFKDSPYTRHRGIKASAIRRAWQAGTEAVECRFHPETPDGFKLLFLIDYSKEVESISANMSCGHAAPDDEIADQADRLWIENYEDSIGELEALVQNFGKCVANADRYPDAEWLNVVRPIGTIGHATLFLVGWQVPNSNEYPLVASDRSGHLWATPLWELQGHSQDPIVITAEF